MSTLFDCDFDGTGCTARHLPWVWMTDEAVLCGHCREELGQVVQSMAAVCRGDVMVWRSRPLDEVVHECGRQVVAEAAEQLLLESLPQKAGASS